MTEIKKRGRPAKAPEARKDRNLTIRTREDIIVALVYTAARAGRSLSQEVQHRLEKSLEADAISQNAADAHSQVREQVEFFGGLLTGILRAEMRAALSEIQCCRGRDERT